ncbi:hypothetical protein GBA52_024365 [Prunus armeniaca]|nr:hypothetical protein GBA52_024365 [Prunus armeniaca]
MAHILKESEPMIAYLMMVGLLLQLMMVGLLLQLTMVSLLLHVGSFGLHERSPSVGGRRETFGFLAYVFTKRKWSLWWVKSVKTG